jgi:hypothetical protein
MMMRKSPFCVRQMKAMKAMKAKKKEARRLAMAERRMKKAEQNGRDRREAIARRLTSDQLGTELIAMWDNIVEVMNSSERLLVQNHKLMKENAKLREEYQKLREECHEIWEAHYRLQNEVFEMAREMRRQTPPDNNLFEP